MRGLHAWSIYTQGKVSGVLQKGDDGLAPTTALGPFFVLRQRRFLLMFIPVLTRLCLK